MMDWEKAEARKQEKKRQRNAQEYGTEDGPEYIREELGMLAQQLTLAISNTKMS